MSVRGVLFPLAMAVVGCGAEQHAGVDGSPAPGDASDATALADSGNEAPPLDAGPESSETDAPGEAAVAVCNPVFCPDIGVGTACCTDTGRCGTDFGEGCVDPYPESSCIDQCPAGSGQSPPCAKCTGTYSGPVPLECGFEISGTCVSGPERVNTCDVLGCAETGGWDSCCPDGTADCGDIAHCGMRQVGIAVGDFRNGSNVTKWEGFPDGCVATDRPGSKDSSCPPGQAAIVYDVWTAGYLDHLTTRTPVDVPGCRQLDGRCGFWYDDPPFGCVDPSVIARPNHAARCGSGLVVVHDAGTDASSSDASDAATDVADSG